MLLQRCGLKDTAPASPSSPSATKPSKPRLTSNDEVPPSSKEMARHADRGDRRPHEDPPRRHAECRDGALGVRTGHRCQPDRSRDAEDRCHRAGDDREDLPEERAQDTVDLRPPPRIRAKIPSPSTANAAISSISIAVREPMTSARWCATTNGRSADVPSATSIWVDIGERWPRVAAEGNGPLVRPSAVPRRSSAGRRRCGGSTA